MRKTPPAGINASDNGGHFSHIGRSWILSETRWKRLDMGQEWPGKAADQLGEFS
jgi:hypothetical protein